MNRRSFIQLAGLAGLGVVAPIGLRASSADAGYEGPFWLMVDANGGWDPTMFCDPKGGSVNHLFTSNEIGHAGNIPYAPIVGYTDTAMSDPFYSVQEFVEAWHQRFLVINGIDTQTNNHDSGSRTTWSGQLDDGYPTFAALAAGVALQDRNLPLAFLSYGGFEATEGVCALSRVGDTSAVPRLAYPNTINPGENDSGSFITPTTASRIAATQAARLEALQKKQSLPSIRTAMSDLFLARRGEAGFATLAAELSQNPIITLDTDPDLDGVVNKDSLTDLESLMQQAQIAALAFKAKVAVSANLNINGFDTHSNHDIDQPKQLLQLLKGLDYIFKLLDATGLSSKTYVVVGSDFGRTPEYNQVAGKDHWNISSMLIAGPTVEGNRVVGATDKGFVAKNVNGSLALTGDSGARIGTPEVHMALRKLAKVAKTPNDALFPLVGRALPFPIFG